MARLINPGAGGNLRDDSCGAKSVVIRGVRFANAAAKFWTSLADEIRDDYPDCTSLELMAPSAGPLEKDQLYPQRALEKDLERLLILGDVREMMKETIAEMEILGPPASVRLRLMAGPRELLCRTLPLDCIDAETFQCLLVWPLEWAKIPMADWNAESLGGDVQADDRRRMLTYAFSFTLRSRHLSEGLYERTFTLTVNVRPVSDGT